MPTWDSQLTDKALPVPADKIPIIDSAVAVGVTDREKISTIEDIQKIPTSYGETYLNVDRTVTISTQSTVTLVGGTDWVDGNLNNFTSTNAGLLTYTGTPDIDVMVLFGTSMEVLSPIAAEKIMNHAVIGGDTGGANNGLTSETIVPSEVTSMEIVQGLKTNDTIQMGVSNRDSTRNIGVTAAKLIVKQI